MNNKCEIDVKLILSKSALVIRSFLKNKESISTLKLNVTKLLNNISERYNIENSATIASTVLDIFKRYGVIEQSPDFFSFDNVNNIITGKLLGIQSIDNISTSTDNLIDSEQIRLRKDSSIQFLEDSYGLAKDVKAYVQNQTNQNLFDALFVNRGSINTELGIVKSGGDLNRNIRIYQEELFLRIIKYLQYIVNNSSNKVSRFKDILNILRSATLYKTEDGKIINSNNMKLLEGIIKDYLTPGENIKEDILRYWFITSLNPDASLEERNVAKLALDAYNANVILNNFDSYLVSVLDKTIQIKDFNQLTGEDKYSISNSTANLATTWRVSENINVESEADFVTKLAINTTPLLFWQNSTPQEGLYLHFSDFEHTIAKIKDLVYNYETSSVVFDLDFIKDNLELWNSLSENTKNFLRNKSLRLSINLIRKNPRLYINSIFELLTNLEFYNNYKNQVYSNFTEDELNKLYSLYLSIFNSNINNSIYSLTKELTLNDYYSYITLTVDSIFKIAYIQYYKDLDGLIQVRTLIDSSIGNIKRLIEQTINVGNSSKLIKDFDLWKTQLLLVKNQGDNFSFIEYTIPNTNIRVRVTPSSGFVSFLQNGKSVENFLSLWNDDNILNYLNDVLRLGLSSDGNLKNYLRNIEGSYTELCRNLLQFAARVTLNRYVGHEFIDPVSNSDKEQTIKNIYGKGAPRYNWLLDELGLVHGNDIPILENIAIAKANVAGVTMSSIVRDGEGNAQSQATLSRLLGSLQSQYELLERSKDSVTSDSIILSVPGLLEGVYTAKEYHDDDQTKEFVSMNPSEMAYISIVLDYIGGLIPRDRNTLVGNGHIMLLPSVNSDKSTIGRIKIDLNKEIHGKPLKDYTSVELRSLIANELGDIYVKMYHKVVSDWAIVDSIINDPNVPKLSLDFSKGFENFNYWFYNYFEDSSIYKTPVNYIKNLVLNYNKTHRLTPLELVDQVHYLGKNDLNINQAFLSQIARFKPNTARSLGINYSNYPTEELFWNKKKTEVLKSLLKNKFKLNTSNQNLLELLYIRKNFPEWIDSSGNMILAKITDSDKIISISSEVDILKALPEGQSVNTFIDFTSNRLILNPILSKYNLLDYLFTLEFMISTVGSFIAHPHKSKSDDVLELEAGHFNAQHKRNVSFTAAMHAFLLNTLNGIPELYNIAVIDDIKDIQGTIGGELNGIKPFDGATFVNPFVVYLENYSLGGAKAGITKKQFVHFKNEKTGTGGIIKTAGFGLTNDWIRNSPFLARMMKKMTDHIWLNEDGTEADIDITYNYKNELIEYTNTGSDNSLYYKQGNSIYRILRINKVGKNEYNKIIQEVAKDGTPKGPLITTNNEIINTNYKLWNFFGGAYSMKLNNRFLEFSNSSVENVVKAMNSIGTIRNNSNFVETLELLWQPLKHVDVHYVPTAGAVKLGAANINSDERYFDDVPYDILRINMYLSGILLDKEHHADQSELSIMTLVVSACAAKGYTFAAAVGLYDALSKSTQNGLKEHVNAMSKYFETDDITDLLDIVIKTIVDNLGNSKTTSGNFAQIIASNLIKLAKSGKKIKYSDVSLPLSDNTVYAKIFSIITSYLTNSGIKLKIPGILSVLTPSYDVIKIYGGRKYESFFNPESELEELLQQQAPVYDSRYHYNNGDNTFMGMQIVYVEPNSIISPIDNKPVVARNNNDGTILIDPTLARLKFDQKAWRFTRNSKPLDIDFKSPREWMNFILLHEAMHNQFKINENETRFDYESRINELALKRLSNNISNLELDRTYNLTYNEDLLILNTEGSPLVIEFEGNLYYIDKNIPIFDYLLHFNIETGEEDIPENINLSDFGLIYDGQTQELNIYNAEIAKLYFLPVSKLIKTPSEYKDLKRSINNGEIIGVTENVKVGRNLSAYNVRFNTIDGLSYLLWDLDSASALFDLNEIKETKGNIKWDLIRSFFNTYLKREMPQTLTEENISLWEQTMLIRLNRWLQNDLSNLSTSSSDLLLQYDNLLLQNNGSAEFYKRYAQWVNIKLGKNDNTLININGNKIAVNKLNWILVLEFVKTQLDKITRVRIDGIYLEVDKNSILKQAYEIIMPKTFAKNFGLTEFDDLNTISNDPDYFIKLYIQNQSTKVEPNLYSIEFKNSDGNHQYVIHKLLLPNSDLSKLDNIRTIIIDGKTYRIDSMDETMYELLDGDEIYVDSLGNEIIATNDPVFYANNLHYDSIKLSHSLITRPSIVNDLLSKFKDSSKKPIQRWLKYVTAEGRDMTHIFNNNDELITLDNYKNYYTHPVIKTCRAKHTSFLKSLDIVAARIPSQSMQSFMPMKVVAFDNPDINTAHVSTMQILLLGSDFDIDAVSLATYDIDRNGILLLWSPYANIQNQFLLKESLKLPVPTGISTELKEINTWKSSLNFINKYQNLFDISPLMIWDKQSKSYIPSPTKVWVELNTQTEEQLAILKDFLLEAEKYIYQPDANNMLIFNQKLHELGLTSWELNIDQGINLFENLRDIVNKHNNYFDTVSLYNLSKIINNYVMNSMYEIILDPVNLILAHTSVDSTTGPLKKLANKSLEALEAKNRTPGNFVNKYESIVENLVGKEGIGICAVGLKAFFALTLYCNTILNNGDELALLRLLIGNKHQGIVIGNNIYATVANIRAMDPNTITNAKVLEILASTTNDTDAAIILSALLSLATDNAKELALSKLNASTKMIGMYIYGVTIGMEFKDLANILMSPVGAVFNEVSNSNIFAGKEGYSKINDYFFKYFDEGPRKILLNYNTNKFSDFEGYVQSPLDYLSRYIEDHFKYKNETEESLPLHEALSKYSLSRYTLKEKLFIFDEIRKGYNVPSKEAQEKFNLLIDFCLEYITQGHIIGENNELYYDIKKLAEGAAELRTLGQILSVNQGIKTNSDELLNQIHNIERLIYNRSLKPSEADITKGGDMILIDAFIFNEEYRLLAINKYESVKHSFNILDVIATVPHYFQYIQALAIAKHELLQSFKFRSIEMTSLSLKLKFGLFDESKLNKGIQNYVGDYLIHTWMKDRTFLVPKGNKAFGKHGDLFILENDTIVDLGTDWGRATFRMWLENEVIPNLKQGRIKENINFPAISDNKFIKDLGNDLLTTTITKNPDIIYTLPINMLPRIDTERLLFNGYKTEFEKLSLYNYEYNGNSIPIVDLFIYYAMIADHWKLGEKSLVPIFEGFQNTGLIEDFHKHVSDLDKSEELIKIKNAEDIILYIAPFASPYSSFGEYIQYRNPISRKMQLMLKISGNDFDYIDEMYDVENINQIKSYEFKNSDINTNLFPRGEIDIPNLTTQFNSYGYNIEINYDLDKSINYINVNGNPIIIKDLHKVPIIKLDGEIKIDINLLGQLINDLLNPC